MKVAVTHPYSWPEVRRGTERIVVETARALARRGHAVTVLTAGAEASVQDRDGVRTVRLRRRFAEPRRHEAWFAAAILPRLVRGRFDAVHSMMPKDACASIAAARLTGHRTVYEEMGNPHRWWWAGLPDRWWRRAVVRWTDVYGCMSRYAVTVLEQEWRRPGVVIPGGVDLAQFRPAEKATQPTILFSGALSEPRKGVKELLDAAALLVPECPQLQVWLSGPGDAAPIVGAAPEPIRTRTHVLPLGDPEAQGARYGSAWVTAHPALGDSFGMVLIESLASGTPIVVVDDAAPPELVTPETGVVAAGRDPAVLAAALADGLRLAQRPGTTEACRASAARFGWDKAIAPLLENLYSRSDSPRS